MDSDEIGGAVGAETSGIGAAAAPGRRRRMTAGGKRDAVLRILRREPLEIVARVWRDGGRPERLARCLSRGGGGEPEGRERDSRDETIDRLRTKVGALMMGAELLPAKIERLEAGGGGPFGLQRLKR